MLFSERKFVILVVVAYVHKMIISLFREKKRAQIKRGIDFPKTGTCVIRLVFTIALASRKFPSFG